MLTSQPEDTKLAGQVGPGRDQGDRAWTRGQGYPRWPHPMPKKDRSSLIQGLEQKQAKRIGVCDLQGGACPHLQAPPPGPRATPPTAASPPRLPGGSPPSLAVEVEGGFQITHISPVPSHSSTAPCPCPHNPPPPTPPSSPFSTSNHSLASSSENRTLNGRAPAHNSRLSELPESGDCALRAGALGTSLGPRGELPVPQLPHQQEGS